jgi:hypothetical protein
MKLCGEDWADMELVERGQDGSVAALKTERIQRRSFRPSGKVS